MENNSLHTFVVLAYKESPYLEECIESVLNQSSQVIIATTTKNKFIEDIAKKYSLKIVTNDHIDIGGDFDFALNSATTPLVTIAHQDDIYDKTFSKNVIDAFHKHPKASIIFTDYYELRNNKKVYTNANLKIKRILLFPAKVKNPKSKFGKRNLLRFGNAISCPTVTFVKANCPTKIFSSNFECNVDWHAWETLSKKPGTFVYISKPLMGHRISADTTTTEIINSGIRTKEDYEIFKRFWPKWIAKLFTKFYQKSEKSNSLEEQ